MYQININKLPFGIICVINYNYHYIISYLIKFKGVIPDALKTACTKCTDVQISKLLKIMKFLIKNRSDDFDRLMAKYDTSGEYKKKLEKLSALEAAAAAKH